MVGAIAIFGAIALKYFVFKSSSNRAGAKKPVNNHPVQHIVLLKFKSGTTQTQIDELLRAVNKMII